MDDRDVFDELLAEELEAGMSRADVLKRGAAAGAGIYGLSALFGAGTALAGMEARSLTPTFYQWIYGQLPRHPEADQQGLREDAQARREDRAGAGLRDRPLRRRGEEEEEHVGRVRRHDALRRDGRPDRVGHDRAVGQVHPEVSARRPDPVDPGRRRPTRGTSGRSRSCSTSSSRRGTASSSRRRASTPTKAPKTWDEFIANAKKVVSSKAAPYGAVFDAHGWRSLAPIAHTFTTNVYTPAGLFDFTNDAAVNALEIMKRMMEVAPKNILEEGKVDGGVNIDARRGSVRRTSGGLLRQVPERADALRRHVARPEGAAHRRPAEGEERGRHRVLEHGRGALQVRRRTSSRRPTTWST